jgi:hypothetical protein
MDAASPVFENLSERLVIPNRETLQTGFRISPNCVVRNPSGTGFGGGAVAVEVLDARPDDQIRLSPQFGIEIDGAKVTFHGRFIGSILASAESSIGVNIRFEPRVYYDAASALIAAIEFSNATSLAGGTRTIALRVTNAEGRTVGAQIILDLPMAYATGPSVAPEIPVQRVLESKKSGITRKMSQICILMARMRSGTTAFRDILATHPRVFSLGEIFHNHMLDNRLYFHNYFLQSVKQDPALSLPSEENRYKLFSDYISYIKSDLGLTEEDGRVLVLGINYNSLHSLNSYWQHPFTAPFLFQVLRRLKISIIHMRRENLLRTLVSEHRARRSGIWHRNSDSEQQPMSIELNLQTLLAELEERHFEIGFIEKCLTKYPNILNLTYEETFGPNNVISHDVLARCAEFLDVGNGFSTVTGFRPTAPPTLREAISNYEDVARLLSETQFAIYLDEAEARND